MGGRNTTRFLSARFGAQPGKRNHQRSRVLRDDFDERCVPRENVDVDVFVETEGPPELANRSEATVWNRRALRDQPRHPGRFPQGHLLLRADG
jgi:hypothetical protein